MICAFIKFIYKIAFNHSILKVQGQTQTKESHFILGGL